MRFDADAVQRHHRHRGHDVYHRLESKIHTLERHDGCHAQMVLEKRNLCDRHGGVAYVVIRLSSEFVRIGSVGVRPLKLLRRDLDVLHALVCSAH